MATPLKVFLLTTVCLLLASRIGSMALACSLGVPVAKAVGYGQFQILGALRGDSPAEWGGPHEVGPRGKTFPRPKVLREEWMGLSQSFMFLLDFVTGWDGLRQELNGFPDLLGEASRRNMPVLDGRHPRKPHGAAWA